MRGFSLAVNPVMILTFNCRTRIILKIGLKGDRQESNRKGRGLASVIILELMGAFEVTSCAPNGFKISRYCKMTLIPLPAHLGTYALYMQSAEMIPASFVSPSAFLKNLQC